MKVPKLFQKKGDGSGWRPSAGLILQKKILENDWVCGDHFHSGEAAPLWDKKNPNWVQSLNLGHDKLNQSAKKKCDTATKVERGQRVTERRKRQLQRQEEDELKQKK